MDYDRLRELQQKFEENPRRYFAPLANEYRKGGQPRRAIEICRAQLEQMPGHMSGQIVYGQALYEAGEFDEARQVFERALALDPENLIALRSLGDMSLQAGNTQEARSWYSRLLDADPKDTAAIALISEIDASSEATPVPTEVPGIDTDVGDQQIPAGIELLPEPEPAAADATRVAREEPAASPPSPTQAAPTDDYPPLGLERHYPVEEAPQARIAETPSDETAQSTAPEALKLEDLGVPSGESATEGLTSARADVNSALDSWSPTASDTIPPPGYSMGASQPAAPSSAETSEQPTEIDRAARAESEQPEGEPDREAMTAAGSTQGTQAEQPAEPAAATESPREPEPVAATAEKTFTGASAEPFVNETMAKLYLKQGYKQLALKVYRQLAYARPDDDSIRAKIAAIEAEDRAEHPGEAPPPPRQEPAAAPAAVAAEAPFARREQPSEETATEPEAPRSPSIETPTPDTSTGSEDDFGFESTPPTIPHDLPPEREPTRERESVESPAREEPRAEPHGIAARQPSIREFFATLGRRRPPRPAAASRQWPPDTFVANPSVDTSMDTETPFGATPPAPTLDSVFAGANVSPADARAASRLAGAFSGTTGTSRTPPTPPMPTPRVNPRVQAQESEEDVAKFRAWLDGLTSE